jgi:hypothetical protein
MISWATIRDEDGDGTCPGPRSQTEEAALHLYRARYEEALSLAIGDKLSPSRVILEEILAAMAASPFKDQHIEFLTLCNLSRVCERQGMLDEAYMSILKAVELDPVDVNAVTRAALLAAKTGDIWTARAMLATDTYRQKGFHCLEDTILDSYCEQEPLQTRPVFAEAFMSPPLHALTIDPKDPDLTGFIEQICHPDCWLHEEITIRRVEQSQSAQSVARQPSTQPSALSAAATAASEMPSAAEPGCAMVICSDGRADTATTTTAAAAATLGVVANGIPNGIPNGRDGTRSPALVTPTTTPTAGGGGDKDPAVAAEPGRRSKRKSVRQSESVEKKKIVGLAANMQVRKLY